MKFITKLGLIAVLTSSCCAANALTLNEYNQNTKVGAASVEELTAKVYLSGIAQGLIAANDRMYKTVGKSLFCMPDKKQFGYEEMSSVIDSWLKSVPNPSAANDYPIEMVGLVSLEHMYPCH